MKKVFILIFLIQKLLACDLDNLLKQYTLNLNKVFTGDKGEITIVKIYDLFHYCNKYGECLIKYNMLVTAEAGSWKDQYVWTHGKVTLPITLAR
jgi:hypothetical protein